VLDPKTLKGLKGLNGLKALKEPLRSPLISHISEYLFVFFKDIYEWGTDITVLCTYGFTFQMHFYKYFAALLL